MTLGELALIYLACGAATLPLSIMVLRFVVSLSAPGRELPEVKSVFDRAVDISVFIWLVGGLAFYFCAAHLERQRSCSAQRTNQLTAECRRELGASVFRPQPGSAIAEAGLRVGTAG